MSDIFAHNVDIVTGAPADNMLGNLSGSDGPVTPYGAQPVREWLGINPSGSSLMWVATGQVDVDNTATETTMLHGSSFKGTDTLIAPAAADVIRFEFYGRVSVAATVPTLTLRPKINGTEIQSTLMPMAVQTAVKPWRYSGFITLGTIGATATVECSSILQWLDGNADTQMAVNSDWATSVDLTGSPVVDFTIQWGTAHADNEFEIRGGQFERLAGP